MEFAKQCPHHIFKSQLHPEGLNNVYIRGNFVFVTETRDLRFKNVRFHIVSAMDSLCMTLSTQYTMCENHIVSVVHNIFGNHPIILKMDAQTLE